MKYLFSLVLLFSLFSLSYGEEIDIPTHLQETHVTVKVPGGEGSGVLILREHKVKKDSDEKVTVSYVLTCGHVVESARSVRDVYSDGKEKKVIEFKDAKVVQQLTEKGRRVGETSFDARVIKYSDADDGEDLAVLVLRKQNYSNKTTKFYLDGDKTPNVASEIYHCGSFLGGDAGHASVSAGIISQIGRVLETGRGAGKEFDQSDLAAFGGSSGGGMYLKKDGRYIGMLVRGYDSVFNVFVPVRRIYKWTERNNLTWLLDESKEPPTLEDLEKMSIE